MSAAAVLLSATMAAAGPMPKEAGVWFDDTGKGAVKIEPCGTKLCGRIVWLKSLVNDKGEPLIDRLNPDARLSTRPICGLQVVGQLEAVPEGGFDNGWIYDPKQGKSFSVAITLSNPDELTVTGYKGVKFLSKTFTWTRAKTELPNCAAAAPTEAKAAPAQVAPAAAAVPAAVAPAAAKSPAKAVSAPAATAPAPAPANSKKAGTAEALPWAGGADKAVPPKGASNLGASKIQPPKAQATKSALTKTSVTPPKAASSPSAKAAANPAAQKGPSAQNPALIKPKPAVVEPLE